ncbi:MAG: hypothetical protein RIQ62_819 [Bacteroidota bacterium]
MRILSYLLLILFVCSAAKMQAQLVNGCGFLQQNRLEIGIANNGAYGTPENCPLGYHPNNNPIFANTYNPATGAYMQHATALGFVADWDSNGWAVGTPPYFGDYFLPGTPQEGWSIEVGGIRCDAFSSEYQTSGTTGFVGTLSGTNQYVTTAAGATTSLWTGSMGNLQIKQLTRVKQNKLYFTTNVKLYNTGGTPLSNVYYMRTLDPDNDVSISNNFSTTNVITYALPNPGNKTLVGCTAVIDTNAYLGLGTIDCRSKAFINNFGLFPPTDTLGYLFSGTHPDLVYTGTLQQDVGVGIVWQLGNILPGDSTELNFAYILNEASLDEALDEIKPKWLNNSNLYQSNDTIYACANTVVPVSIVNGENLSWTWSSSAPLSGNTGISNSVTFGTSPVQVTAVGTGICVDTITFYLAPASFITTTINAGICSGNAFTFNGVSYTTAGVYHDTVTTPSGCDSIVTLNLTVGANSFHTINASACQGLGYLFNGNILTVSGTYFDTLMNAAGCDSIITLNLTIGTTTTGTKTVSICAGDTYLFNGVYLSTAGTYLDTLVNSNGCDSILTLTLSVKPLPVGSFTVDKLQICNSDSVQVSYTGTLVPGYIYTYNFSGGVVLSGSGSGPYRVKWNSSGTKTITLSITFNGCNSIPFSQNVNVIQTPDVIAIYDSSICLDGTAQITAQTASPNPSYLWNLNGANLINGSTSNAGPLTLSWNTTGVKMITIQCDNQGCFSNIDTAYITVHELPTANIVSLDNTNTYCETDEVHLSTDFIADGSYSWTPLANFIHYDFNNATLIIYDTILVSTRVMTSFGCIATDTMSLYTTACEDYFIPNSFTPNNDGHNDYFHVVGLHENAHVDMNVYNRWGNLVYQGEATQGWDGRYKGKAAESGVYFYYLKITFPTGKTVIEKGDLTLLR